MKCCLGFYWHKCLNIIFGNSHFQDFYILIKRRFSWIKILIGLLNLHSFISHMNWSLLLCPFQFIWMDVVQGCSCSDRYFRSLPLHPADRKESCFISSSHNKQELIILHQALNNKPILECFMTIFINVITFGTVISLYISESLWIPWNSLRWASVKKKRIKG